MALVEMTSQEGMKVTLAYATPENFVGKKIYAHAHCYLIEEAAVLLEKARVLAMAQGYGLHVFDAFRPQEAQWALWECVPDPMYVADPRKGSSHSRGIAVDLTLYDLSSGQDLDMGTPFDDLSPLSHLVPQDLPPHILANRYKLMGIMLTAGFDFYRYEWWHYQLYNAKDYPLLSDADAPRPLMAA